MTDTGLVRKIDELGRIVLPPEVRRSLGIQERDSFRILTDKENKIIVLQKAKNTCFRCHSEEDLRLVKDGIYLCGDCIESLL